MMPIVGTYYGQWVTGQRHGFGVRRSAPFSVATPMRHSDERLQKLGTSARQTRRHYSMPGLVTSPPVNYSATLPGDTAALDRHRSGFVLTGDRDRESATVRRPPRSRSSSLRRSIADSFSSINRRHKSMDDPPPQVSFYITVSHQIYRFTLDPDPDCPLSCPPQAGYVRRGLNAWKASSVKAKAKAKA